MTRSAEDVAERPWDAVAGWLRRFVAYIATKRVIAEELRTYPPKTPTSARAAPPRSPKRAESLLRRAQMLVSLVTMRPSPTVPDGRQDRRDA